MSSINGIMPLHIPQLRVLFLCTHNSARSQLAEALLRHLYGDAGRLNAHAQRFDVFSAGTERTRVKPEVPVVLAELGVPSDELFSKTLDDLPDGGFDIVVTVCDQAKEACPYAPGRLLTIHQSFPDPSEVTTSPEARVQAFRETRDAIRSWLRTSVANWPSSP